MIEDGKTQAEIHMTSSMNQGTPDLSTRPSKYVAKREWMEFAFILLYPVFMPLPILNVVAGILSSYAVLSLTARGKLGLVLVASAIALGSSAMISFTATATEFNTALIVLSTAPILALALGFRWMASMKSAFMLMALVSAIVVGLIYALGAEVIGGIFNELNELAAANPELDAVRIGRLVETLSWLTPALIAIQALLPVTLTWYLAPTIERVLSSGQTVELATSRNFHWLTLTQWRLPRVALVFVFVFAAGRLLADSMGIEEIKRVCDNLLLISVLVFSITGFAVVEFVFRRFRVTWTMRLMFYLLALISALPGTVFLAIIGISDTHFDLRSKILSRAAKTSGD